MSSVFRPTFEVVKKGRILHFVSGYRRFAVNDRIIQRKVKAEAKILYMIFSALALTSTF